MKHTPHHLPRKHGPWLATLAVVGLAAWPATLAAMDHSLFITQYQGTSTCLQCHTKQAEEVMSTVHWTWRHTNTPSTGETQELGKSKIINNYCVAVRSNEPRCTSCHIGIGWRDETFDFENPENVDCLVCHDTTGTYKKTPTGAGAPDPSVDLTAVAQSVGKTSRQTCGSCHFYGGGGDAVKHGDLDSTMANPTRELDVHMGVDGLNQSCAFCHAAGHHELKGSRYSKEAPDNALCESCHTATPHSGSDIADRLNTHTARVACQTCHVPAFARGGKATKMFWDWSTAGEKNPDGSDKVIRDEQGNPIYHTKKGSFRWEANVVPEYVWFNGDVVYYELGDPVDPDGVVQINRLLGDVNDPRARIVPVKRFEGIQPMDAGRQTLAVPHLFPSGPDDTDAFWKSYDWLRSLTAGMAAVGQEFSGEVGWVRSEMFWVQNHMVAPKEQALKCTDCHTPGGRLNFAALGYPAEEAQHLQTLFGFAIAIRALSDEAGVELQWETQPGYRYQVQVSEDLSDPANWTDATGGTVDGDGSVAVWRDPDAGASQARFYRVLRTAMP